MTFIHTITHANFSDSFVSFTLWSFRISVITPSRPIIFTLFIWLSVEPVIATRRCVASTQTRWRSPIMLVITEDPAVDTKADEHKS